MGKMIGARPSPAIVVAAMALVAALAGTAIAGPDVQSSAINKKKVKKIARKQVDKLAPDLSVGHADTADTATSANTATRANTAARADTANRATSANPVAYAQVRANGTVVGSRSKGVSSANVEQQGTGGYCFVNLGFQPKGLVANADYNAAPGDELMQTGIGESFCSAASGAPFVQAYDPVDPGGDPVASGFFVIFYN